MSYATLPFPCPPGGAAKGEGEGGGGEASWGEVLTSRATIVGMLLFLFQQFSGINAIVYFSSSGAAAVCVGSQSAVAVAVLHVHVCGCAARV